MKNTLIATTMLIFGSFSANAQMPAFPKELKALTDALNLQVPPPQKQESQGTVAKVQPLNIALEVKTGTYVALIAGKQDKENFIIIKKSDSNQLDFYVEVVSGRGSLGERDGIAKRKGNIFQHSEGENSNTGQCEISFEPKGNKIYIKQEYVCGMGAGAALMNEYVFVPDFKPVTSAEKDRLNAEKIKTDLSKIKPVNNLPGESQLQILDYKDMDSVAGAGCTYDIKDKTYLAHDFSTVIIKYDNKISSIKIKSGVFSSGSEHTFYDPVRKIKVDVKKNGNLVVDIAGAKSLIKSKENCGS